MNKMYRVFFSFSILMALTSSPAVMAQQTMRYRGPEASFYSGLNLLSKGQYNAAGELFSKLAAATSADLYSIALLSEYYVALSANELNHEDAGYLLEHFIARYPQSSKVQMVYFELGKLYYRDRKYNSALAYFKKVDLRHLSNDKVAELYFKKGYSQMREKQYDDAMKTFYEIMDSPSPYTAPATYYYSHIAYVNGELETALKGFNKLADNPTYRHIIPYYLLNIYYLQGKYDDVIQASATLPGDQNNKRNAGLQRVVAEAYFKTGRYGDALSLLEEYTSGYKNKITRDDWYELAYCYYATGDYEQAIRAFQKTTTPSDSVAQSAFYHLGYCYIMTGEKKFALNAFLSAYKYGSDQSIQEDALFNYAKLTYELSYDPYNQAINALRQYIADYPDSRRTDEAYAYLVSLFTSTKNYKEALETIEKIRTKDDKLLAACQKITFNHGVELFNDRDYFEAIKLFRKSLEYNYDKVYTAYCYYWIGESYFRLSSFEFAVDYYKKFLSSPGASQTGLACVINYDMGYVYYRQNDYGQSAVYFRRFTDKPSDNPALVTDAFLRLGDDYFIDKKYDDALMYYDQAVQRGGPGSDYGFYQTAMAAGGKGAFDRKASLLQTFLQRYPTSVYTQDALYELAMTWLLLNDDEKALAVFKTITDKYPSGRYIRKALLKTGLIYYNSNENDLAIQTLKKVIETYPGSEESKEALESLRNIYVNMNRVDDYFAYADKLPFADLSLAQQDSITYTASENLYMKGDCAKASAGFESYATRFPTGAFITNAWYYMAECALKANDLTKALQGYDFVIIQPPSLFTENALAKAAAIRFEMKDYYGALNDYTNLGEGAVRNSNIMASLRGQMLCQYLLGDYAEAIDAATRILAKDTEGDDDAVEAHFTKGRAAMALNDHAMASAEFKKTCELSQGEMAAEAQYDLADMLYEDGNYKEAEKESFTLVNQYSQYDYWVARGFILLADNYLKMDNAFQAKQTLQSIIDNYEGDDLKRVAQQKLDAIVAGEKAQDTLRPKP